MADPLSPVGEAARTTATRATDSHADWQAAAAEVVGLVGDRAGDWDRNGRLPVDLLRRLGSAGQLCAQVTVEHQGLGWTSRANGEFTASVGAACSSLRSIMTSQGMAAWAVERLGTGAQRRAWLPRLTGGELAAVGFSEASAGSDLSAIDLLVRPDGDEVVLNGCKTWMTGAAYADLLVVFGRTADGEGAAVVVTADSPGVSIEPLTDVLGCRAAGHAAVRLEGVRMPVEQVLGGFAPSLMLLVTAALGYGRMSVAWGCVGILRACLASTIAHATTRRQFGQPLAQHQLVAARLADIYVAEQTASRICESASALWDAGADDVVPAAVLAKHVSATNAAQAAASAVQILASAGAQEGHLVARAYRDAKTMEIIEGTSELCRLLLAEHAVAGSQAARFGKD